MFCKSTELKTSPSLSAISIAGLPVPVMDCDEEWVLCWKNLDHLHMTNKSYGLKQKFMVLLQCKTTRRVRWVNLTNEYGTILFLDQAL